MLAVPRFAIITAAGKNPQARAQAGRCVPAAGEHRSPGVACSKPCGSCGKWTGSDRRFQREKDVICGSFAPRSTGFGAAVLGVRMAQAHRRGDSLHPSPTTGKFENSMHRPHPPIGVRIFPHRKAGPLRRIGGSAPPEKNNSSPPKAQSGGSRTKPGASRPRRAAHVRANHPPPAG